MAVDIKQVMPVDKAILFGSYAKGYATELSDVDICFFLKDYNMTILLSVKSSRKG